MSTSIKVENLSKIYRLGQIGTGTISKDLERWFRMNVLGQDDPYLKIGQSNDRTKKGESDVVYSLHDINFDIEQGDAVGIIGRNGAGKSTLLKILSRVTAPTTGRIQVKGRVASLLEVGTGFHPELTGRENIFLNGAILGMRKKEIARKLDEIIDFSGVERYIDTPVKRYSSGMYVRLAFAVAAHLESEILIVDEVLAVGDAEFQKKCLGKMGDVSRGEGRTVLFVSHNMQAITTLTKKCIYLKNGYLINNKETYNVVNEYLINENNTKNYYKKEIDITNNEITNVEIITSNPSNTHINGEELIINIKIHLHEALKNGAISIQVFNQMDIAVVHTWLFSNEKPLLHTKGINDITCIIPKFRLYQGKYYLKVIVASNNGQNIVESLDRICGFNVVMYNINREYKWEENTCIYVEDFYWEIN